MPDLSTKSIFLAYAEQDKAIAKKLSQILSDRLGNQTWLKDFDLNGGDLIVDITNQAISDAKWFILFISKQSLSSAWILNHASMALFQSMETSSIRIIIVSVEEVDLPSRLEIASTFIYQVDLCKILDKNLGLINIADYISECESTTSTKEVYVGRGADKDRFASIARRNKIIFIQGNSGIGKTLFTHRSIADAIGKRPIEVRLEDGSSSDYLARKILLQTHVQQPVEQEISNEELMAKALDALVQRSRKFFLLIDNAEKSINDGTNTIWPYLESFLEKFISLKIDSHIVLTTTRSFDYPLSISSSADTLKLEGLDDLYIQDSLEIWLEGSDMSAISSENNMSKVVRLINGHPLAARMVATKLRTRSVIAFLQEEEKFRLNLASHILRSLPVDDLEETILQILASIGESVTLEDLLSVKELYPKYEIDRIHLALTSLLDKFLIEYQGELIFVNKFVHRYFINQLSRYSVKRRSISSDYGEYAYKKALYLNAKIERTENNVPIYNNETISIASKIFRYAIPAARLLIDVGEEEKIENLPMKISGNLRQMVLHFYQQRKDYKKALEYADKWLEINPEDYEILLYKVRCYRNFRTQSDLDNAEQIILDLDAKKYLFNSRFEVKILREKARIALQRNNESLAETFYRQGIEKYIDGSYPGNHVGLAQLLLKRLSDFFEEDDLEQRKIAAEAVKLLEEVRGNSPYFDQYDLSTYVEALIYSGMYSKAIPIIRAELYSNPDNQQLNYRLSDILRRQGQLAEAETYARKSYELGNKRMALITLANILYAQATEITKGFERNKKLEDALNCLIDFQPEYGQDQEIADTIKSKIYRALDKLEKARSIIRKYDNTENPYTLYEQSRLDITEAQSKKEANDSAGAADIVSRSILRIKNFKGKLTRPLNDVLKDLEGF